MGWSRDKDFKNVYNLTNNFNGYTYSVSIYVEEMSKTLRYWVYASSGKKRNEIDIYGDKPNKSLGGMKAIYWIKESMMNFPSWHRKRVKVRTQEYICIEWSDKRRRNIYSRLQKEGFRFMNIDGGKVLINKLK